MKPALPFRLPGILPLFPLEGVILLKDGELPLNIFEKRYLTMFNDAIKGSKLIGIIQPNELANQNEGLYRIGGGGIIMACNYDKQGMTVLLRGIGRFAVSNHMQEKDGYRRAVVSWQKFPNDLKEAPPTSEVAKDIVERLHSFSQEVIPHYKQLVKQMNGEQLVNFLAMGLDFAASEKQALLEAPTIAERAQLLLQLVEMKQQGSPNQSLH